MRTCVSGGHFSRRRAVHHARHPVRPRFLPAQCTGICDGVGGSQLGPHPQRGSMFLLHHFHDNHVYPLTYLLVITSNRRVASC